MGGGVWEGAFLGVGGGSIGGGGDSLNQISVRGVCSTVHDGGLHPAPCLQYTVGIAMHRARTFMSAVNPT